MKRESARARESECAREKVRARERASKRKNRPRRRRPKRKCRWFKRDCETMRLSLTSSRHRAVSQRMFVYVCVRGERGGRCRYALHNFVSTPLPFIHTHTPSNLSPTQPYFDPTRQPTDKSTHSRTHACREIHTLHNTR